MARLNLKAVEERVAQLGDRASYDREFIFDLLLAYGKPKANVTRLRNGSRNVAQDPDREVAQKNVVYFREVEGERGFYAGAVGWCDAGGPGAWAGVRWHVG